MYNQCSITNMLQLFKHNNKFDGVRKNVIFERAQFNLKKQQGGETGEQYILALYADADDTVISDTPHGWQTVSVASCRL